MEYFRKDNVVWLLIRKVNWRGPEPTLNYRSFCFSTEVAPVWKITYIIQSIVVAAFVFLVLMLPWIFISACTTTYFYVNKEIDWLYFINTILIWFYVSDWYAMMLSIWIIFFIFGSIKNQRAVSPARKTLFFRSIILLLVRLFMLCDYFDLHHFRHLTTCVLKWGNSVKACDTWFEK